MRFFEFAVGGKQVYDLRDEYLKEWSKEPRPTHIQESIDEEKTAEFRSFVSNHITDPKKLVVGEKYYPITLIARPMANSITIEISQTPIKYLGIQDDCFVFGGNIQFRLPIHLDVTGDYGPYMMETTVYTTPQESEQFLTLLNLKFSGDWKLNQKRMLS